MDGILSEGRNSSIGRTIQSFARVLIKDAVKEGIEESGVGGRRGIGLPGSIVLVALGTVIGYLLGDRGRQSVSETLTDRSDTAVEAARERVGAEEPDEGRSPTRAVFLLGTVILLGYALRGYLSSPDDALETAAETLDQAAEETSERAEDAADRTEDVASDVAERIEEGGEEAAQRMEEGAERADEGTDESGTEIGEFEDEAVDTIGNEGAEPTEQDN